MRNREERKESNEIQRKGRKRQLGERKGKGRDGMKVPREVS